MKSKKQYRETLISFNERDDRVEVITYNTWLIKRLTALSEEHPNCCTITCADTEIGRYEFSVSKHNFSFRVSRPYTAERIKAMQYYSIWHGTINAVNKNKKEDANGEKE